MPVHSAERKLAAIFAADIAGYSRLMACDEIGTLAAESILESYEPERIAFAQRLVKTTDQAFTAVTSSGPIARFVRLEIVPALLPALFSFRPMARLLFRTVSQTNVNYRNSPLSEGRTGSVHGGNRLRWVKIGDADNFAPLTALDWQVHVYGEAAHELQKICSDRGLPLHVFPWRDDMARTGLHPNAAYLVRPDGYIAVAGLQSQAGRITNYLDAHHIAARAAPVVRGRTESAFAEAP